MQSLRSLLGEAALREEYTGNGIMVALWPSAALASRLASFGRKLLGPDAEPASEMHLTLGFYGDASDYSEDQLRAMRRVVARLAKAGAPLAGKIAGMGRFSASKTSDGKDVLWVSPDLPALPDFRQKLVTELGKAGIEASKVHGYTPHMTLGYFPSKKEVEVPHLEPFDVVFDKLTLAVGSDRTHYPLR